MFCFTSACGLCLAEVDGVDYRKNFSTSAGQAERKGIRHAAKDAEIHGRKDNYLYVYTVCLYTYICSYVYMIIYIYMYIYKYIYI